MNTKERKEAEVESITEPEETAQVDTEATKTYSKEEYEAEIARIQAEAEASKQEALKEQHRKLNERLTRKGVELQQLRQQKVQPMPQEDDGYLDLIIADMKAREQETGEVNPRRIQLEAEKVQKTKERNDVARYMNWQSTVEASRDEINQMIIDAGHDPDDARFIDIDIAFDATAKTSPEPDFSLVKKKLNHVLKSMSDGTPQVSKGPASKETEEERVNRLVEEKIAERMKSAGLLETDAGSSAGTSRSAKEIFAAYAQGDATIEQYKAACKEIGIEP